MKKKITEKMLEKNMKEGVEYWNNILVPKVEGIQKYNGDVKVVTFSQRDKFERGCTYKTMINHKIANKILDWYITTEYYKSDKYSCNIRVNKSMHMIIYVNCKSIGISWIEVFNDKNGLSLLIVREGEYERKLIELT